MLVYGAALAASALAATERSRVAALADVPEGGGPALADPAAAPVRAALADVRRARQSALGLFPHYDTTALDAAATTLAVALADRALGAPAHAEARLALGRVHLHRERDAEAVRALGPVVRGGGYRGPEARRLLDWVRAR